MLSPRFLSAFLIPFAVVISTSASTQASTDDGSSLFLCNNGICDRNPEAESPALSRWEKRLYADFTPEQAASLAVQLLAHQDVERLNFRARIHVRPLDSDKCKKDDSIDPTYQCADGIEGQKQIFELAQRYCQAVKAQQQKISETLGAAIEIDCDTLEDPSLRIYFPSDPRHVELAQAGRGHVVAFTVGAIMGGLGLVASTLDLIFYPGEYLYNCMWHECNTPVPFSILPVKVSTAYRNARKRSFIEVAELQFHFSKPGGKQ